MAGGYGGSEAPQHEYQCSRRDEPGYGGFESRRPEVPSYGRETEYGGGGYEGSHGQRETGGFGGGYREREQEREQETYGLGYGDRGDGSEYRGERYEERGGYRPSLSRRPRSARLLLSKKATHTHCHSP